MYVTLMLASVGIKHTQGTRLFLRKGLGQPMSSVSSRRRGGFFWLSELRNLLVCPRCLDSPLQAPVRICIGGHVLCNPCYVELRKEPKVCHNCQNEISTVEKEDWEPMCVVCSRPMTSIRVEMVEKLLELYETRVSTNYSQSTQYGDHQMILPSAPTRSCSMATLSISPSFAESNIESQSPRTDVCSTASQRGRHYQVSHRPIRCPKTPCRSSVAVTALLSHFQFDHPDVPLLGATPGVETTISIAPCAVPIEMSRCVALILVMPSTPRPPQGQCGSLVAQYRDCVPLPLMTARTRQLLEPGPQPLRSRGDAYAQCPEASVLLWLADVEAGAFEYTATAKQPPRSAQYTGPVASLRRPQTPAARLQDGDCLVLTAGLVRSLSEGGTNTFQITVVVT